MRLSAISLGVFWRFAPSTSKIILSIKLSPFAAVILTFIQSDMTVVPPVTELRSPPLSLITGADSPVTALSFTLATPSITSPSDGTSSPARTSTMSPFLSFEASIVVGLPFAIRFAFISLFVCLRLAA